MSPIQNGLFNGDIIYLKNDSIQKVSSKTREKTIAGVLVLNTFHGKFKDSFIYKFVPYDKQLPIFLVPYKNKNLSSFDKSVKEVYAVIKFSKWTLKHPEGTIVTVIGDVRIQTNFYVYLLHVKHLFLGIKKFNDCVFKILSDGNSVVHHDNTKHVMQESIIETLCKKPAYCINKRLGVECYTIDGPSTEDYDDAFSIQYPYTEFNQTEFTKLSIYITNVPVILDGLNLWEKLTERYNSVYLPDAKQPMLPSIMTNCLTTLSSNTERIVFTIDVYIQEQLQGIQIIRVEYENSLITIKRNYTYRQVNEFIANNNPYFLHLSKLTNTLKQNIDTTQQLETLSAYDIIETMMVFTNKQMGGLLYKAKNGIYRINSTLLKPSSQNKEILNEKILNEKIKDYDETTRRFFCEEYSTKGEYTTILPKMHEDVYIHATSPIRRIVDIANIALLNQCIGCVMGKECIDFICKLERHINKVNEYQSLSRKIERECDILYKTQNLISKKYEEEKSHVCIQFVVDVDGIVFNKSENKYSVYIPKLKACSTVITTELLDNYSLHTFNLYFIKNEHSVKQKIRLELKHRE